MDGKASGTHMALQPVTSQPAFDAYVTAIPPTSLLVLYFEAPWAAPCEQMSVVLSTLASTYPVANPPTAIFLSVNTDDLPDIAEQYDVTAVPYVVLSRNGKTLETISGGDAAKVRTAVEKHAGVGGGGATLPPAQSVTRPDQQPFASGTNGVANGAVNGATNGSNAPSAPIDEEDLNTRLGKLLKAAPVMLFMKGTPSAPQCGFSRQLVATLRQNNVRYGFFNILADEEVRQGLKKYSDWPTFPQLYLDGELVGGLDIVKEELENDPEFFTQYSVDASKRSAVASA